MQSSTESEVKKSKDSYEFLRGRMLGRTSFGRVTLAVDKTDGLKYAIKLMNKKAVFEQTSQENLEKELNIHLNMNHDHITKLYNYFEDEENICLVLQYAENGSMFTDLRRKKKFTKDEAFTYFLQTCLGVDYLHKKKIICGRVIPEKILLDIENNVKLGIHLCSLDPLLKIPIEYMAPELIKKEPYDCRVDIWCLGVLSYEMVHGHPPCVEKSIEMQRQHILSEDPIFDSTISPECGFSE